MFPKKCAECGGEVQRSTEPIAVDVRGESVRVPGIEHGRCAVCGEEYLPLDAAERLQKEAVRQLKAARRLLAPEEIRAIRRSLAMSQAEFEKLLGVGPKTVVRWEKGAVFQSATADRLMRLIAAEPAIVELLTSEELYHAQPACCGARPAASWLLSGQWRPGRVTTRHLRLVRADDNAAAA